MSGSVEITMWLHAYQMEALEKQLRQHGTCVEQRMQDMLMGLYASEVPIEEQEQIHL